MQDSLGIDFGFKDKIQDSAINTGPGREPIKAPDFGQIRGSPTSSNFMDNRNLLRKSDQRPGETYVGGALNSSVSGDQKVYPRVRFD